MSNHTARWIITLISLLLIMAGAIWYKLIVFVGGIGAACLVLYVIVIREQRRKN